MLGAGTKVGPFEIVSAIGAGGMGEVYRAKDTRLDRIVAIKVLPGHLSSNPDLRARFEREAKAIDVARLAEQFPDVAIVIDQMADTPFHRPEELQKLLDLHSWPLSSHPYSYLDSQQAGQASIRHIRTEAVDGGSDWPLVEKYCTYKQAIDIARNQIAVLSPEDKSWICGQTAQQVWRFELQTNNDTNHLFFSDCGRRMGPAPL
jgi:serine/threonine protein kinase